MCIHREGRTRSLHTKPRSWIAFGRVMGMVGEWLIGTVAFSVMIEIFTLISIDLFLISFIYLISQV